VSIAWGRDIVQGRTNEVTECRARGCQREQGCRVKGKDIYILGGLKAWVWGGLVPRGYHSVDDDELSAHELPLTLATTQLSAGKDWELGNSV
jgi:hypothetical protein